MIPQVLDVQGFEKGTDIVLVDSDYMRSQTYGWKFDEMIRFRIDLATRQSESEEVGVGATDTT